MNKVIQLQDVQKTYPGVDHPALTNVNFVGFEGEFIVLVGPSGCGKSTLVKLIAGLEKETAGVVMRPAKVSMVFQSGALFPWLTVAGNVDIVLEAEGSGLAQRRRKTRLHLEATGLTEFAGKRPRELSGGQRQRVGIARALAVDPQVLVLDEPFAALDIATTENLHHDLIKIWSATKKTIVMVSHSVEEAVTLADRVVLMSAGHIVKQYDLSGLKRPRREQGESFIRHVQQIRKDLLALSE